MRVGGVNPARLRALKARGWLSPHRPRRTGPRVPRRAPAGAPGARRGAARHLRVGGDGRLNKLANAGLVKRRLRIPGRSRAAYQISARGLAVIGSSLGTPRVDLRDLRARRRRRLALARRPRRNVRPPSGDRRRAPATLARRLARAGRRAARGQARRIRSARPRAAPLSGPRAAHGRRPAGRARARADPEEPRPASRRSSPATAPIRASPASSTWSRRPSVARSVEAAARRLGIAPLVHVQRVRSTVSTNATAAAVTRPSAPRDEAGAAPRAPGGGPLSPRERIPALRRYLVLAAFVALVAAAHRRGVASARSDARGLGGPRGALRRRPSARPPPGRRDPPRRRRAAGVSFGSPTTSCRRTA